jgi:prevent-host-death family protein
MKRLTYSTYEAKARFSEILRKVRHGESVLISYRGEEVAEIRPIARDDSQEKRLRRLEASGILSEAEAATGKMEPVAERPGALERFLASRNEDG